MRIVQFIPSSQRKLVFLAAQTDSAAVLVIGSSGTGKSALARWIHQNGPRAAGPLITLKKDETLSSQLVLAHGGSLVIPEIGELSLTDQKNLLDSLKNKVVNIGTPESPVQRIINARIIATTSQSLEGRAQGGLFNRELFLKLNVFRVEMPDLSDRPQEFREITTELLDEIKSELHREYLKGISDEAFKKLEKYDWPGNLRELRNVLRIAVITCKTEQIEVSDLPDFGPGKIDFLATREEFEKIYLTELLNTFDWKIDKTAEATRIDQHSLKSKIERYGIIREVPRL